MSKKTFEFEMDKIPATVSLFFLDLIKFRELSNSVATTFEVKHESPQVILLENGKVIFHTSHSDISALKIAELIYSESSK